MNNNRNSIDWDKINKEIIRLDSFLKNSIIPSEKLEQIFTNKTYFRNLTEIKEFMTKNFKIKIEGRSKKEILSQIAFISLKQPDIIPHIENLIQSQKKKIKAIPIKKPKAPLRKKREPIEETLDDWTKLEPKELNNHLNQLTLIQIKSISGTFLTSSEKRLKKALLIDTLIKKIDKLKAHYEMGPG
ncbi:MAG: hypothetical protein ACFFAH_01400 [Promethearchaeota archaeon]